MSAAVYSNPNPEIGRNNTEALYLHLRVGCWNIANAGRDEENNPLSERLGAILAHIGKQEDLDVLVFLEAGRKSRDIPWVAMASLIEQATGMEYGGLQRDNGTENPFAKAYFFRRRTCALVETKQTWLDKDGALVAGPGFGNSVTTLTVLPVVHDEVDGKIKRRVLRDTPLKVSFVHLPMRADHRMQCIELLKDYDSHIIMGDCNTFPDDGGPEMIDVMVQAGWKSMLPEGAITFTAFPHDLCKKAASYREQVNPESEIVSENPDGTINVRFSSPLDQVFLRASWDDPEYNVFNGVEVGVHPNLFASDHALIIAEVVFR